MALLRDPLGFMVRAREFGDVVSVRIGPRTGYVLTEPTLVQQMLVDDAANYHKGIHFEKAKVLLGNGLVTTDGIQHRRQRRLVHPAFQRSRIRSYATVMTDLVAARCAGWRDGQPLDLDVELRAVALAVAARTLFSAEIGARAAAEIQRSVPMLIKGVTMRAVQPTGLLERLPTPGNRRFDAALARLNALIDELIAEYRADGTDRDDLLSMLTAARDRETGEMLSDRQLHDEVMTLLIVGSETTANALGWACHLVAGHPGVQERLQAEADAVLSKRPAGYDDLPDLSYTRQVLLEALRLYPPVWVIPRRAVVDVELGGFRIPRGSTVLCSPYALHRDPASFAEAERFDPDRWSPARVRHLRAEAYLPFGAGLRGCVGEAFAWAEAGIVLGTLAGRWTLEPAPGPPVRPARGGTLQPSSLRMIVRRR